jgi:hypothetical protein
VNEFSEAGSQAGALGVLQDRLRRLHRRDGEPSTREIARRAGRGVISHTTVAVVLRCARTPKWGQLELVVEALRGDPTEFHSLWVAARDAEDDSGPTAMSDVGHRRENAGHDLRSRSLQQWLESASGLVIEDEVAELKYLDGAYRCEVQRLLYNAGVDPVIRYPARIMVDRYPREPERSKRFYREHPLTWEEMNLTAYCGNEVMSWEPRIDRDSMKELWLLFENETGRFPLYQSQRAEVSYSFQVGEDKWGPLFSRQIRNPIGRLAIRLDFPASSDPLVWGVEGSLSAASIPLRTPIKQQVIGTRVYYSWSTERPPLHTNYRLEWRLRHRL